MTDKTEPFLKDIIRVLQDIGGKAQAAEVIARVIKERGITEADYEKFETETNKGLEAVRNRIRWARQTLVFAGYLRDNSDYGYWELSRRGQNAESDKVG